MKHQTKYPLAYGKDRSNAFDMKLIKRVFHMLLREDILGSQGAAGDLAQHVQQAASCAAELAGRGCRGCSSRSGSNGAEARWNWPT